VKGHHRRASEALSTETSRADLMDKGLWIWPSDAEAQHQTIGMVASSPQLVRALALLSRSSDGLSNAELDDQTADNSNWITLWTMRQLTSLGFVEYSVDLFGGPARFHITSLGRTALGTITGKAVQPKPSSGASPTTGVPPSAATKS